MKKLTLITVALLAGTTLASAADMRMPMKAAPMAPPPSGTGPASISARTPATASATTTMSTPPASCRPTSPTCWAARGPAIVGLDRNGFIGGGQIGYNWQFAPNWLFGIEADISYTDFHESTL